MSGAYRYTLKHAFRINTYPSMAVDCSPSPRAGTIYMVWSAGAVPDIIFSKSTDGGRIWSAPTVVNDVAANDQWWPWIAVDPSDGEIAVTWQDSRDDPQNILSHTYVGLSTDGGTTWINRRASGLPSDLRKNEFQKTFGVVGEFAGDYNWIEFRNGVMTPAWTDLRSPYNSNIWAAKIAAHGFSRIGGFRAATVAGSPRRIDLAWTAPTSRAFGQPLDSTVRLKLNRDGARIALLPRTASAYSDSNLAVHARHTYSIIACSGPDSGAPATSTAWAGGDSAIPAPTEVSASWFDSVVVVSWRNPATRADGTSLTDLGAATVWREGTAPINVPLSYSDAGMIASTRDTVPKAGYYSYRVEVRDDEASRHSSVLSGSVMSYAGVLRSVLSLAFDGAAGESYLASGAWVESAALPHSAPNCIRTDTVSAKSSVTYALQLAPVRAPNSGDFTLAFWQIALATRSDSAVVEVSSDRGATWSLLAKYDSTLLATWRDGAITAADWTYSNLTLAAFAGDTLIVRFRLRPNPLQRRTGWFLDDISIGAFPLAVFDVPIPNAGVYVTQNPFAGSTIVRWSRENVRAVVVADALGRVVARPNPAAGEWVFDASDRPSGTYWLVVDGPGGRTAAPLFCTH
jgi:hypothetical protein